MQSDAAFVARLARMSPRQRIEASRNGSFSRHERAVWACRYPDEVPTMPEQRIAASRNGGFTRHERAVWACRYPDEVPTINGEFEWLVISSADLE